MRYIVVNLLPIVLAGLAGAVPLWLLWRRGAAGALGLLASLWIAAILAGALIIAPVPGNPWLIALVTATILWAGFILPALLATMPSRGVRWRDAFADAGGWLVALLVQAAVLRFVGLAAP